MKRYIYSILLLGLIGMFSSCERDHIYFDESMTFVAFTQSSVTIPEEGGAVQIPVLLSGLSGTAGTTVSFEVSAEGQSNPASGSDYSIAESQISFDGEGEKFITVTPVDNDVFTGNKSFTIKLTSTSAGYQIGADKEIVVTLKDNEHPLGKWIGTYTVEAASYGNPGAWDETWTVVTSPDNSDVSKLQLEVTSGGPVGSGVSAVLNLDEMTITIAAGQTFAGNGYGYGDVDIQYGFPDLTVDSSQDMVGTISEDGTISIDNVGTVLTGANAGYVWDVFNTTWTKQ